MVGWFILIAGLAAGGVVAALAVGFSYMYLSEN